MATTERDGSHRALGLWEQLIVASQRRSGMYNIASKLVISTDRQLEDDVVRKALKSVAHRHPLLRCVTGDDRGVKSFIVSEMEPVFKHTEEKDSSLVMESELLEIFDDQKCLWRVTRLIPDMTNRKYHNPFVFTFHHAIVDGTSIIQVCRDFLTFLEMELRDMQYDVTSLPLKQSRDILFGSQSSCTRLQRLRLALTYLFFDCICPAVKQDSLICKIIHGFRPRHPIRRTRCIQINFDSNETSQIIQSCKQNNVRVNAFISALVARSLHRLLLEHDVIRRDDVIEYSSECYVNMRRFTEALSSHDLGLYMSHVPIPVRLANTNFWQDAKMYDDHLHACLDSHSFLQDYQIFQNALKTLGPRTVARVIALTDHRSMPYYISNLGRIEIGPDVDTEEHICKFEELHQTVGEYMTLSDGSVFIHSVVTVNGRTFWTLGYHAHQVADEIAQELARSIRTMAIQACELGHM